MMVDIAIAVLLLVTVERLAELVIDRRNRRRLLAAGAREYGARHYPWMVAFHSLWLGGLWLLAPGQPPRPEWLVALFAAQALRLWVQVTLGPRWTTRILVLPDAPLIRRGPFRLLAHPNYLAVVVEVAALPLAFGLVGYALVGSLLNGLLLVVRIGVEDRALGRRRPAS